MAMAAQTLTTAFNAGTDERPGGKEVGCSRHSQKEKEGKKRGAAATGHLPFKRA
jgi:hypothetical protein